MKRTVYVFMVVVLLCGTVAAGAQESMLHPFKVGITAGTSSNMNLQMSFDAWLGMLTNDSTVFIVVLIANNM